jgi:hypothetical protein
MLVHENQAIKIKHVVILDIVLLLFDAISLEQQKIKTAGWSLCGFFYV